MMMPQRLHIHHSCTAGLPQWCLPVLRLRDLGQDCNAPRRCTYGFADLCESLSTEQAMDGSEGGHEKQNDKSVRGT